MPSVDIKRESDIVRTSRVLQTEGMFDVPAAKKSALQWTVHLPIESKNWHVGLIVGPSGSGKTTIAKELFGDYILTDFAWDEKKSVIDNFPAQMSIKEIISHLSAVGFGTVPAWLRPFHVLSNGEQFRVNIARALAETKDCVVVDEFTSVVDRKVAKIACHSVQKAVRRQEKQLIALTCHYDVIDWLQPDWVYEPHTQHFAWRSLRRFPEISIDIYPVSRSSWEMFRQHHYMSGSLVQSCTMVGAFYEQECVAISSWYKFPHATAKNIMMGHRLVVLPDYQGLGIGCRLDDWCGEYLYGLGYRYHNVVAHPAMIRHYSASPRWRQLRAAGRFTPGGAKGKGVKTIKIKQVLLSARRNTASFCYVPKAA